MKDPTPSLPTSTEVSFAYRLGLVVVTVGMVVLPVIYLALTACVCWGVYYYATEIFPWVWSWRGGGYYGVILKTVASCTPLLMGAAIAISMLKPLVHRRRHVQALALNPAMEPRVAALVERVCRIVGAPAPKRVELDCDLNASASFERGWRGFFGGELVLRLGLPLVAGVTERELAGVIAHEFGHFRQKAGMRSTWLIRVVNHWFARVIYARDGWDEMIDSWAEEAEGWSSFVIGCVRAGVSLSRGVLWLLMMAGHGLSGFLLRQMEFDADRWEVRTSGSASFESTTLRIAALAAVMDDIRLEMRRSWRRHLQLPDNLPVLIGYRASRMSDEKRQRIEGKMGLEKTGWFDTHPSFADRVRAARAQGAPGVLEGDGPARELFDNFVTGSRLVTLAFYEDELDVPTGDDFLIPIESIITGQAASSSAQALVAEGEAPAPAKPALAPIPMMSYDPSRFRKPDAEGQGTTPSA